MATEVRVVLTILGMGAVTYATRAGGIWAIERIDVSDRAETALEAMPGAILISLIAPALVTGGVPEWGAALAVLVVAVRTESIVLAMGVGIGVVWLLQNISGVLV
jgi:uncharacterized membrane protein